ncbi:hypothetical protein OP10G_4098 [Fimbriimonas ginsengisoli Gsoil 348]|uniref:Uncharacterized protein n=1 Tax=Fimbriimonas ginsengisoli Gsoil 348 TaxID=661478 RepID=A0A068NVI9_FIMGI|nr:hypothetical protein OP10G_4098 [Fimbriimonas ginsengisoli Gsoil 348]
MNLVHIPDDERVFLAVRVFCDDMGYLLMLANHFGFQPTRAKWFSGRAGWERERLPKSQIGWWLGWRLIGEVTDFEAVALSQSLEAALGWLASTPSGLPEGFETGQGWNLKTLWEWCQRPSSAKYVSKVGAFVAGGAFRVRYPEGPIWTYLERTKV